jgi:hypothetical protein
MIFFHSKRIYEVQSIIRFEEFEKNLAFGFIFLRKIASF